jgi:hypothetical protein
MKEILQIELTNHCNRACHYCPHGIMTRPKGFMAITTVIRCFGIARELGQTTLGINHYGEPLLHPDFLNIVFLANHWGIDPIIYTNGDFLSDDLMEKLGKYRIASMVISGHGNLEYRKFLASKARQFGINAFFQSDVSKNAANIAGQMINPDAVDNDKPPLTDPLTQCRFLRNQLHIVLWDGSLVPCCFDFDGKGIFANIFDENILTRFAGVFDLCHTCPGHPGG